MTQPNLFQNDLYPHTPGFKDLTTSKDNATRLKRSGRAETLRNQVLAYFTAGNKATADEVAEALGEPFIAVRPRLSELRAQNLIKPTGERRHGIGGGTCHVWSRV